MHVVVSSKYCKICKKRLQINEMKLGREQIENGERIFRTCPICGTEIEDVVVNEEAE